MTSHRDGNVLGTGFTADGYVCRRERRRRLLGLAVLAYIGPLLTFGPETVNRFFARDATWLAPRAAAYGAARPPGEMSCPGFANWFIRSAHAQCVIPGVDECQTLYYEYDATRDAAGSLSQTDAAFQWVLLDPALASLIQRPGRAGNLTQRLVDETDDGIDNGVLEDEYTLASQSDCP
jgi:hypothetical protein